MRKQKHITQIIGLPRTRTAWLSVALTAGNCFAFHDAANPPIPPMTVGDYMAKLHEPTQEYIVDCSSHLIARRDLVAAAGGPIVIIERDISDARKSYAKHIGDARMVSEQWDKILAAFDELKRRFADRIVYTVGFSELSYDTIVETIHHLVDTSAVADRRRIAALQNFNIQERKPLWAGA